MRNGEYELIKTPKGYPGKRYRGKYAYEHRVVWWQNTGELPGKDEVIHHRNGDTRDNRFDNLGRLMIPEHSRNHSSVGRDTITLECSYCGKEFERECRRLRRDQKDYYCNRSCMGKDQWKSHLFSSRNELG